MNNKLNDMVEIGLNINKSGTIQGYYEDPSKLDEYDIEHFDINLVKIKVSKEIYNRLTTTTKTSDVLKLLCDLNKEYGRRVNFLLESKKQEK